MALGALRVSVALGRFQLLRGYMTITGEINMDMLLADVLIGRVSIVELSREAVSMLRNKRDELMQSDKNDDKYRATQLSAMFASALHTGTPHFGTGLLPDDDW